ncbi:hypothetical protein N8593_01600 [bacterium]|nr:hypothetical protein [Akkermansiaceae bacterium]MDA7536190.1 hypothetical protein [bacterium]MDA7528785.1 hypothetical protein [Akkermansiaceae bacterium]MDA7635716.1 hypothetical protein [Akkermansiaceae bacterium]MDA7664160.1 hypothetical protein [bacterium]
MNCVSFSGLASCHFRDLAEGLQQQMFFWGQDVIHPRGNQLVQNNFQRLLSEGLKGTSRYRREWQNGHIELYGSCAGWYGPDGGFVFIRPRKRIAIWTGGPTPILGVWQPEFIKRRVKKEELYMASLPFLDWLIDYEGAILDRFGNEYREENYYRYDQVPKATSWLRPEAALRWLTSFRETPNKLFRPKKLSQNH